MKPLTVIPQSCRVLHTDYAASSAQLVIDYFPSTARPQELAIRFNPMTHFNMDNYELIKKVLAQLQKVVCGKSRSRFPLMNASFIYAGWTGCGETARRRCCDLPRAGRVVEFKEHLGRTFKISYLVEPGRAEARSLKSIFHLCQTRPLKPRVKTNKQTNRHAGDFGFITIRQTLLKKITNRLCSQKQCSSRKCFKWCVRSTGSTNPHSTLLIEYETEVDFLL